MYHSISSTKTHSSAPNDLSRPCQISKLLLDSVGRGTIVNRINNYSVIDQPPQATPLPGTSCSILILMLQHPKRAGIIIPIQWMRTLRLREVKRVAPEVPLSGRSWLQSWYFFSWICSPNLLRRRLSSRVPKRRNWHQNYALERAVVIGKIFHNLGPKPGFCWPAPEVITWKSAFWLDEKVRASQNYSTVFLCTLT